MRWEDLNVDKVYINTVAKVGSASFLDSLKAGGFKVHHGHSLAHLRQVVTEQQNCLIVSGIRNPIDRNLSYFFQTYGDDFFNDVKLRTNDYQGENCYLMPKEDINKVSPLRLAELFLAQPWHYTFTDWFLEFFEIAQIDFLEFNKQRGIGIYALPNNNFLLFYVFEKLYINTPFIEAFFGIRELSHSNNSEERIYRDQYKRVKTLISLPTEYKDRLLHTPVMNNFYDRREIAAFYDKY